VWGLRYYETSALSLSITKTKPVTITHCKPTSPTVRSSLSTIPCLLTIAKRALADIVIKQPRGCRSYDQHKDSAKLYASPQLTVQEAHVTPSGLFVCCIIERMKTSKPLTRKTPLRAKKPIRCLRSTKAKKPRLKSKIDGNKTKSKGYQIPKWFLAIKPGAHGNTPTQKRLWRVVSETYRAEDFAYSPYCPCCGHKFTTWQEGQLGHWLRYSLCKGWMKVERVNLQLICAPCNYKDDAITLKKLGEYLQLRYGRNVLDYIEHTNNQAKSLKLEDWQIVDYVARLRPDLVQ
jgi:hypothetical protein